MRYIINGEVIFNTEDCSIVRIENSPNENPRFISTIGARLLELLVTHNHQCLERGKILECVWDQHGLYSSGNNLNNLMSIIRRTLAEFDVVDVIITNPKVGFTANFKSITIDDSLGHVKSNKTKVRKWLYINTVLSVLFILSLILNFKYLKINKLDVSDDSYITTDRVGNCSVHFKNETPSHETMLSYCQGNVQGDVYVYNPIKSKSNINKKFEVTCNNSEGALCISDSVMDYTN